MAFTIEDCRAMVDGLQPASFGIEDTEQKANFLLWITQVDAKLEVKRPLLFYAVVARWLAENLGTMVPEDFADPIMRVQIEKTMLTGTKPFPNADEPEEWKKVKLMAGHLALANRVQTMAASNVPKALDASSAAQNDLAKAMTTFVNQTQCASSPLVVPYSSLSRPQL